MNKMIQRAKEHKLGIAIGSTGWMLLFIYLIYEYTEYGSFSRLLEDITDTNPPIVLFHTLIVLSPAASMLFGYLTERLEKSNRLKDLFMDIVRHDLLNPAGGVRTGVELALQEEKDPDKKEVLQTILDINERLIAIIENASKLAKLESGEELEFKVGDLGDIMRSVAKEMTPLADEKKVKIKISAEGEFPALINPLIYDVFSNLINNAIKHGPEDSDMIVGIDDDGTNWKVSVTDKGEGISDEHKAAVFDRFKRREKGAVKGTGLGLAIVKMVVEAHKGRSWVEDNPKGGSIFYVTISKSNG